MPNGPISNARQLKRADKARTKEETTTKRGGTTREPKQDLT